MRRLCLSGLAGLVLVLGGCGSAGGDGLSEEASAALSDHLAEVRGAVADEEPAAAQQALDALHAEARHRAQAGEISSQRLAAIGTAVDDVERWLEEIDAEPEPQPEPEPEEPETEEPEPEPEEPEAEDPDPDPDPGEGNNGKGKDKDEDDKDKDDKDKGNNGGGNDDDEADDD